MGGTPTLERGIKEDLLIYSYWGKIRIQGPRKYINSTTGEIIIKKREKKRKWKRITDVEDDLITGLNIYCQYFRHSTIVHL